MLSSQSRKYPYLSLLTCIISNGFCADGFHPSTPKYFPTQHYVAAYATGKVTLLSENKPVNQYNTSGLVTMAPTVLTTLNCG